MIALIQRVSYAKVIIDHQVIGEIQHGILALIGVEKTDQQNTADRLLERILNYRIFPDPNDKMNLNVVDTQGGLLLVPQFTLAADTKSGNRPGFSTAMAPEDSKVLFDYLLKQAILKHPIIAAGEFGAHMQVISCNEGPTTFILSS